MKIYTFLSPKIKIGLSLIIAVLLLSSCRKYLNAKPDKAQVVPVTLKDYQAILDDNNLINEFPVAGDISCDDYFLKGTDLSNFTNPSQQTYRWSSIAYNDNDWLYNYANIERLNIVLDGLKSLDNYEIAGTTAQQIKGSALFMRGFTFFQLANIFSLPFDPQNNTTLPGIPLRLTSDITAKTTRATMKDTYSQIISDLKAAAAILPITPSVKTRPSKPAAYGALARTYLAMRDYVNANLYADSCLSLYNTLIDYNSLDSTSTNPISLFNKEVIFHAVDQGGDGLLYSGYARVDSILYASYLTTDLRRPIFYAAAGDNYYYFKGDYSGQNNGQLFCGIAVDEILLIRAETDARLDHKTKAIEDLNSLLANRYAKSSFVPYPVNSADPLAVILTERRKELAFRGSLRWYDLRRLNIDSKYAKALTRNIDGSTFTLPPNDNRYALLIPASVIQISQIVQNAR